MTAFDNAAVIWLGATLIMASLATAAAIVQWSRADKLRYQHVRVHRSKAILDARRAKLQMSRSERLVAPLLDKIAGLMVRLFTPAALQRVESILESMGPTKLTARRLLAIKMLLAPAGFLLGSRLAHAQEANVRFLLSVVVAAVLFHLPNLWVRRRADARAAQITRELPDVLDQVTISVGAGLGLEAALTRVSQRSKGALGAELRRTMQDLRIGIDRRTAFESLARRTGSEDVEHVVAALLQGLEMGMPLSPVLGSQASELRRKRRARAEEKAHKLSVKLTFPTAMCILPALLLVVIGPAILTVTGSDISG